MTDSEARDGYGTAAEKAERRADVNRMGAQALRFVQAFATEHRVLAGLYGLERHFPKLAGVDAAEIGQALAPAADELDHTAEFIEGTATNFRSLAAQEEERRQP